MKRILIGILIFLALPIVIDAQVVLDSSAYDGNNSNTTLTPSVTIAGGHTNLLLVGCTAYDSATASVSGVAGAGGTWARFSTQQAGNANMKGECWWTVPTLSGAQTVTFTFSAAPGIMGAIVYSLYGAHQTTPIASLVKATSGDIAITISSGDMAVSWQFNNNDVPAVTGCTTAEDNNAYDFVGHGGARCTSSPTSTFTWTNYSATSIGLGVAVTQASGGGGGGGDASSTPGSGSVKKKKQCLILRACGRSN